ncbi:tetratricopeptide repeat protein [Streptomyces sp. NPDC051109]|uniref:tetratricopeptide repeat protein n=1 Tax=Streptomyces sp. NPDC051109 TaxID=3365642 RepID=UPI0037B067FF
MSTAVRIEPELLRVVRVRVEPTLDVSAEADVWYGPWSLHHGGAYMALQPTLLPPLRELLSTRLSVSGPEDPLRRIGDLIAQTHRGLSPVLALEERVTWAAVLADAGLADLAVHTVDELMEPVLRAAVENHARHAGLRRWFTGAGERLPERVRSSRNALRLAQVLDIGGMPGVGVGRGAAGLAPEPPGHRPPTVPETTVLAVRHDGGHITVGDPAWPATAIEVPSSPNLMIDVSDDPTQWEAAERITLRRGATRSVPVQHVPVYLRTEAGVVYALGAPHDHAGAEYGLPLADAVTGHLIREQVWRLSDSDAAEYGVRPAPTDDASSSPPPYLPRQADRELAAAVTTDIYPESSRIVLLVGAPKSGRTRTLWEGMIRNLPSRWVLRPPRGLSVADLAAVLREEPLASPAVLWLDDLDTLLAGESGEELADSLGQFLDDPAMPEVLVLATAGTDPFNLGSHARSLLARATTVQLPAAFTPYELETLVGLPAPADPRITETLEHHRQGRIAQYLAGLDRSPAEGVGPLWLRSRKRVPLTAPLPNPGPVTGRSTEARAVLAALTPVVGERTSPVVAVTGLPGVGKTTLVLSVAQHARDHGPYRGGVVFLALNGNTPGQEQSSPDRVLNRLLRALGTPLAEIPAAAAEQAELYRIILADLVAADLPVLVVLDDAASWGQVQPLLPGVPGIGVLLTTRSRSAAGTAECFDLALLAPEASVAMLDATLQQRGPDHRLQDQPAEALQLVELCGRLPLALTLLAARLAKAPALSLTEAVAELAHSQDRLARLDAEEGGERPLRSALELSCERLTRPEARALQCLATAPGVDISTPSAVRLFDVTPRQAAGLLAALADAHLLEAADGERWRMHDLIRLFAQERVAVASSGELKDATSRLATFYLVRTRAATAALRKEDRRSADRWLAQERSNLLAMIDSGPVDTAVNLALALVDFLTEERLFADLLHVNDRVLEVAATRSDDRLLATALTNRGAALTHLRRFDEAVSAFERAHDIHRAKGDAYADALVLNNLGAALLETGRTQEATEALATAVEQYAALGYGMERAEVLDNLGTALLRAGRAIEALDSFEQALALVSGAGRPRDEARQLTNLAGALRVVGRLDDAVNVLERAADLYSQSGAHHGRAQARNNLGNVLRQLHRSTEAVACLTEAVTLFSELSDGYGEGQALNNLGAALLEVHQVAEAVDALLQAARIHAERGDRSGEAQALNNLGLALFEAGRFEEALEHLLRSRTIYHDLHDHPSEAQALNNAGNALRRLGRHAEAVSRLSEAIVLLEALGDTADLLVARDNLGMAQWERGQPDLAAETFRANLLEYEAIGDHRGQAQGFNNLGSALVQQNRYQEAVNALRAAAELLEALGDRGAWAHTAGNLGLALEFTGRRQEALEWLTMSADAFGELGDIAGRSHALYNLGSAQRRVGRDAASKQTLREAARLSRLLGRSEPPLETY